MWEDLPGQDPRTNGSIPPGWTDVPVGQTGNCLAAANIEGYFKQIIKGLIANLTTENTWFNATSIIFPSVTAILPTVPALNDTTEQWAQDAVDAGPTALDASFPDETFTTLECILSCDIAGDGGISSTQLANIYLDVDVLITDSLASTMFKAFLDTFKAGGLMAMEHAAGIVDADCSACDTCAWESFFDFRVDSYISLIESPRGNWVIGSGWEGVFVDSTTQRSALLDFPIASPTDILSASFTYRGTGGSGANNLARMATYFPQLVYEAALMQTSLSQSVGGSGLHSGCVYVEPVINSGSSPNDCAILTMFVRGNGTKPAGWP
jgi:hypothetical protein